DANGRFQANGFGAGKVTVAARRSAHDPWVLAEPQPILNDVVVTLPAAFALTVRVLGPDGAIVAQPKLKLLPGKDQEGGPAMMLPALQPRMPRQGRASRLEDGRVRIADLPQGDYIVLASSDTAAMATMVVNLNADAEVAVQLPARVEYRVRVLGPDD